MNNNSRNIEYKINVYYKYFLKLNLKLKDVVEDY